MIAHFKQCRGTMIPSVAEGDVDMARYLRVPERQGYAGPLVFETPPHQDALEYLSESFDYVRGLAVAAEAAGSRRAKL